MANAELKIKIEDGGGNGGGGGNSLDADMLARWKALFDAMDKSAKDLADKFDKIKPGGGGGGGGGKGSGVGAYQKALAALNGDPIGPAGRSFSEIAAASMNAPAGSYGRPADATDEEWAFYQLENNRRAVRAAKEAERLRKKAQADQKKADAEAKRLEDEAKAEEEAKRKAFAQRAASIAGPLAAAASGKGTFAGAGSVAGGVAGDIYGEKVGQKLGGGLGGMLGAAAGPIGSAVGTVLGSMIGEKVGKAIDFVLSPFENMQRALNFAGEAAKKVAGNDGFGLVQQGLEGTASVLENIPIAGAFAAGALRTVGTAAKVAVDTLNAFAERGKELAKYNGGLALGQANQDLYRTFADMREANRLERGLSQMIQKQTEFDASMRGLLMPLKEWALNYMPGIMDKLNENIILGVHALGRMVGAGEVTKKMAEEAYRERMFARMLSAAVDPAMFWLMAVAPSAPVAGPPTPAGPLGLPFAPPGGAP